MITIEYVEDGEVVSDFKIDDWIEDLVFYRKLYDKNNTHFLTSTGLIIDAVRVAIKQGRLPFEEIQFKYKEDILPVDKNGRLSKWPNGFNDKILDYLSKL